MNNNAILIVEDESIVAEDLAGRVRQLGYEVADVAATGEAAVTLARRHRPALVLMDIRLAGPIDGIAAAEVIKRECNLPVLFLTAHSDADTVERARQAGASGYILKPFDERDLRIQIEMALFKHEAERQQKASKDQLAGINQILQAALTCPTEEDLGLACLEISKNITGSLFGFIGESIQDKIKIIAICGSSRTTCEGIESAGSIPEKRICGLYGRVIREGKGFFTNDPASHPDRIGLPEKHLPLGSFLCVPMEREGGVVGVLAVCNREGYTQKDQDALEALAPSIVEAFSRKRAEKERQRFADELQNAHTKMLDFRRATINMMQDAVIARHQAEEASIELQREIVDRKQAQLALQLLNNELEERVEHRTLELQETQKQYLHAEKLSAIGKLSASIAHEFNNPLQGILSVLKGLKKRAILDKEDRQLLEEAIVESNRMKDLIRNLQEFNRPSTGKKKLMDLNKALDSVLLLYKSDFKGKMIAVERDYSQQLPQIEAVSDQIKQVFLNLLINAADACLQGGGLITVRTWQKDEETVAVAIKDNGIGIQASDMERIFQPFYTTKPEIKGTGLGLSVSFGIIKKHQGKILVESQPGRGAVFTILLPIKGAEDA